MQIIKESPIKRLIKSFSRWSISFILLGFTLLVIAFIIALSETYFSQEYSYSSTLMSLGIGVFSLGVAFLSIKMANESDEKMTIIANTQFMEIYEEIQNLTLREILPKITEDSSNANNVRSAYIWKYNHSLDRAIQLKDWADESHKANLVLPYRTLLERIPWHKQMLKNNDIKDILDGYILIKELDAPNNLVEEIEELIEKTIVKRKKGEDLIECINRTQSELDKKPLEKFKSPY